MKKIVTITNLKPIKEKKTNQKSLLNKKDECEAKVNNTFASHSSMNIRPKQKVTFTEFTTSVSVSFFRYKTRLKSK